MSDDSPVVVSRALLWNRCRFESLGHIALLEVARMTDPEAKLWFGDFSERHAHIALTMTGRLDFPVSSGSPPHRSCEESRQSSTEWFLCVGSGLLWWRGSSRTNLTATRWIPPIILMVASSSQLRESNTISEQKPCGHVWHRLSKHS